MRQSAGLLLYRQTGPELEFFLIHPGGPIFAKKDLGVWSVPKGELDENEEPLHAAIREFEEEVGTKIDGDFIELQPIIQKGGKKVLCWAVEGDLDPSTLHSNTFEMQWPPKSGKMQSFVEVDRGDWFTYEKAILAIKDRQIPLLDQLITLLG
ncbi:putative NUDIX family NTP pyrophosphohydrolase [Pedobacter psychrotolerans]|uniref:DNA mismatch repair protein MutT n=1 Tax=Pedobacter psychrotolerans TaxID=1843235 RepID=A0A4R2HL45_9SPHI|nr:NUDIX domain-containing protein [Pedobacter psychrotolerans]TCO30718.1 putative NUDIX family NTP pyrophosphohydrolase [Pedobacter psychrotolerans]GGE44939.1 DNA mismatch repair protein MutT [Pedobacter psychrotolerans]